MAKPRVMPESCESASVRETLSKVKEGKKKCTNILFEALENRQYASTVRAMVFAGADTNSRNKEGKTPFDVAALFQRAEAQALLQSAMEAPRQPVVRDEADVIGNHPDHIGDMAADRLLRLLQGREPGPRQASRIPW